MSFGRTCASTFDRRDSAGPGWREEARRTRQVPVGSCAIRGSSKQPDCVRRLFHRRHVVDPCCFDANPLWCYGSKETRALSFHGTNLNSTGTGPLEDAHRRCALQANASICCSEGLPLGDGKGKLEVMKQDQSSQGGSVGSRLAARAGSVVGEGAWQ